MDLTETDSQTISLMEATGKNEFTLNDDSKTTIMDLLVTPKI